MPTSRSVSDIKARLLQPALTSHYEVQIGEPIRGNWNKFRSENMTFSNFEKDQLTLSCCDTVLPGSTLSTHDINNDFTGVTERHAYRRLYDDRIDLTFYVDAEKYLAIKFFETWIKYIANEQVAAGDAPGVNREDYSYAFRYPDDYVGSLKIIKFERTGKGNAYNGAQLVYNFVNAFPIAINSMGVSYESSQLLKCTVSFTYLRYYIENIKKGVDPEPTAGQTLTPAEQAAINNFDKPSSGNGFSDPKLEASAQAALGGPTLGSADLVVERAYQTQFGNQEDITINSFGS